MRAREHPFRSRRLPRVSIPPLPRLTSSSIECDVELSGATSPEALADPVAATVGDPVS